MWYFASGRRGETCVLLPSSKYKSDQGHKTSRTRHKFKNLRYEIRRPKPGCLLLVLNSTVRMKFSQYLLCSQATRHQSLFYVAFGQVPHDKGLQERGDGVSFVFSSAPTDVQFQTVVVGATIGQACLLLAAGKKGRWFMMPHAKAMIQQPCVPSSGLMPGSDVLICANEAIKNRDTLVKLLSRCTGNSIETVAKVLRRPFYMDSTKAQEFGVIDKGQGACNFKLWHDLLGKGSEGAVARELKVL
ncbi:hypothetical protein AAC387_Pa12g0845 [Persea americana]